MNALHAVVLSSQCERYAEVIDAFADECERDEKLSDKERRHITFALDNVVTNLRKLRDEIYNNH